jgi:hypothetical protein
MEQLAENQHLMLDLAEGDLSYIIEASTRCMAWFV